MLMLAAVCTGCTNYAEEYSKNTLVVKSSGKIIEIAVEDFKDTTWSEFMELAKILRIRK